MKKLLIATTALVATAGMASADITISGHAAAGIYSGLSNKDATAAVLLQQQQNATARCLQLTACCSNNCSVADYWLQMQLQLLQAAYSCSCCRRS